MLWESDLASTSFLQAEFRQKLSALQAFSPPLYPSVQQHSKISLPLPLSNYNQISETLTSISSKKIICWYF